MSPTIHLPYLKTVLLELLNTPSPTGNTSKAIDFVANEFARLNISAKRTPKGALLATLPGSTNGPAKALSAHVDTLGGMVKEIKSNGRLAITNIGGYYAGSVVGEYCTVETANGQIFTGTVVQTKQSIHIHNQAELHRSAENLASVEIRLDAHTTSKVETEALGIAVGDFVSWDPRAQITEAGFIKSRHLDDKASVSILLAVAEAFQRERVSPNRATHFYISTYEEVGHGGASGIPDDIEELLVIDIGIVGEGQASDEFGVSICPKDGSGPYDLQLRRKLVTLAQAAKIPYNLDVFVNYASDGSAAWQAGAVYRVGLIGPGVDSTHAYERTHEESLRHTAQLIIEYMSTP
jgi:putative aminopeptidase FrvX